MNASDVRRLYAYTNWSNDRLLAVIAGLPEEQFTREIVSIFPSIRDTLARRVCGVDLAGNSASISLAMRVSGARS